MARTVHRVGVVGLGTMGAGIAEVCARSGLDVVGVEADDAGVARGRAHLEASTARAVRRGKLSEDQRAQLLGRVRLTTDLADLADADLVVEAVPERMELKRATFAAIDAVVAPDAILATNTSSLSVTEISVATSRPGRVVGMHFFNPAPVQNLVEVIATVVTEAGVLADAQALVERLGKVPVTVEDRAGFIANALLFGYLNHAVAMLDTRYASREDIDDAMRLGCGYPMGPLALLDLIGLDTAYEILDSMYRQGRDRLHAPHPLLKHMTTAGLLGRKSGRGFYTYEAANSPVVVPDDAAPAPTRPDAAVTVRAVGVVGSGTMACGIAEVLTRAGYPVTLVARSDERAQGARDAVSRSLGKGVERGKIAAVDRDEALGRLEVSSSLADLAGADLVVEAVVEDLGVKRDLFAALDTLLAPGAILATTTSSLPVVDLAAATSRPGQVVGLHFFNPAPVMRLVEVVSTISTSAATLAAAAAVCAAAGKHVVRCTDRAGFIVNALLFPYLNDAVRMLEAHYASADDIDTAMKLGCGLPMGPFELLDVVGLDVALAIEQTLYRELREPGYAPAPRLEHLVTAGYLGRKTGRGFRLHGTRG